MSGFRNPIVAGLDLIRAAIRSPNYVPGVSGWSINKDGTAEFQNLTARGDIDADSITVPTGAATNTARLVVQSNIPPELATFGIEAALLFYAIDEVSGLERGYFFFGVSNDSSGFVDQPTLQLGEVQYPIPGDPGSATVANVKPNQFNVMMDNLIPMLKIFNLHISDIGGLFIEDGGRFGSIDGTFGTSDVDVFEITQDGTGGIARLSPDALLDVPAGTRGIEVVGDQVTASQNGVNGPATTSGNNDTTSTSYVNMAGTGSQTSFPLEKRYNGTRVRVTVSANMFSVSGTTNGNSMVGVNINGVDYDVVQIVVPFNAHVPTSVGIVYISGINAGSYTVQGRWKRTSGDRTLRRDTGDWLSISAEEVN